MYCDILMAGSILQIQKCQLNYRSVLLLELYCLDSKCYLSLTIVWCWETQLIALSYHFLTHKVVLAMTHSLKGELKTRWNSAVKYIAQFLPPKILCKIVLLTLSTIFGEYMLKIQVHSLTCSINGFICCKMSYNT